MKIYRHLSKYIPIDVLTEIVDVLHDGKLVVLPTDTSYMLGADATNPEAVHRLYSLKHRPLDQPVSLCFSDLEMAEIYAVFPEHAMRVAKKFLPGPLTLVLPVKTALPATLLKNNKVGVRIPDVPVTLSIVRALGKPVTATSANRSGGEEPYTIDTVSRELDMSQIDYIVDAGELETRPVSTIAEPGPDGVGVLRQGPVTEAMLNQTD